MTEIKHASTTPRSATAVDIGVFSDGLDQLDKDRSRLAELQGFEAKVGQTLVLPGVDGSPVEVLVGLGVVDELKANQLRQAAAAFVRAASRHKSAALSFASMAGAIAVEEAVQAVAEGAAMATYRFTTHKGTGTKPPTTLNRVTVVAGGRGMKAAVDLGNSVAAAVNFARDLVNEPGGSLPPVEFVARVKAQIAATGGSGSRLKVTAWDEKRIAKEKLGGLLSVNKGSTHPPRFLKIDYTPAKKAKNHVALIGKGVTFDSGGLSIKTGTGMMTMKIDMAGGAAVAAAMTLLAPLKCPNAVTAYVPLTDNMINGDATRPGDTFTARNGKTVEVLNTDAEGRLILADALAVAAESRPDAMVDIATLTGSVTAALGTKFIGLMGNDETVIGSLQQSSASTSEALWHLPLPSEYRSHLDSTIADLRNIGTTAYGGALTAGLFLKEFVDDVPWAHLDLGLSALADSDEGINVKGATGIGVRILADFATNFASE